MKAIVYPFIPEYAVLVRHRHLIARLDEIVPVALESSALGGIDATTVDGGHESGVVVTTDLAGCLDGCDVVYRAASEAPSTARTLSAPLREWTSSGAGIVIPLSTGGPRGGLGQSPRHSAAGNHPALTGSQPRSLVDDATLDEDPHDLKIGCPVIVVTGAGEHTMKFEVQLRLTEALREAGYKTVLVGSRSYADLFGFNSFPASLRLRGHSDWSTIGRIREFLKRIERSEEPDVMVIGAAGAFHPISRQFSDDYGFYLEALCYAAEPDIAIACTYCSQYLEEGYLDNVRQHFEHRFSVRVGCFVNSNVFVDWASSIEQRRLDYLHLPFEHIPQIDTIAYPDVVNLSDPDLGNKLLGVVTTYLGGTVHV